MKNAENKKDYRKLFTKYAQNYILRIIFTKLVNFISFKKKMAAF